MYGSHVCMHEYTLVVCISGLFVWPCWIAAFKFGVSGLRKYCCDCDSTCKWGCVSQTHLQRYFLDEGWMYFYPSVLPAETVLGQYEFRIISAHLAQLTNTLLDPSDCALLPFRQWRCFVKIDFDIMPSLQTRSHYWVVCDTFRPPQFLNEKYPTTCYDDSSRIIGFPILP